MNPRTGSGYLICKGTNEYEKKKKLLFAYKVSGNQQLTLEIKVRERSKPADFKSGRPDTQTDRQADWSLERVPIQNYF